MRILAPLPLLVAVSNVLGIQIMLPFGHDRSFTFIVVGAAVINVFLAFLLVPLWQQNGMAVAVLAAEAFVTLATLIYLSRNRLNPLQPLERNDA
jgi:PST family polysaccharide transporter